jgi:membrane-bound serine protease (ClpP class)
LTLAAHVAVMHPTSNIGAAHPVSGFGGDIEGEMARKVENDTAAWARSLAQSRGRNSEWAKKAVLESAALTAGEAKQAKVVDLLSASMDQLLSDADGRIVLVRDQPWRVTTAGAAVVDFDRNPQQRMHALLANPTLVYLLLLLGILGVYVEMQNPGMIVPGVLGAACLFVVFGVQTLPLNSLGLLLIGLSAVLFFAEVYVTSFGVLSVAAIAALVAGSSMLFDVTGSSFRLPTSALWGTALSFSALVLWIGNKLLRAKRQGATSGTEVMVGSEARALSPIAPGKRGKVFFDGSYWDAQSEEDVAEGQRCRVERVDGLLLHVSPLLETDGS